MNDNDNTISKLMDSVRLQQKEIEQLRNELKNYKQDASRYQWLRNTSISYEQVGRFTPYCVKGQSMEVLEGDDLDKCIDRAMS